MTDGKTRPEGDVPRHLYFSRMYLMSSLFEICFFTMDPSSAEVQLLMQRRFNEFFNTLNATGGLRDLNLI